MIKLGKIDDIPDGEARGFDPFGSGRDTMFIVRQGAQVHAWHDRCPHEGATPMPFKRHAYLNKRRSRIVCYAHGAQFDIESGLCLLGPCTGASLAPVALVLGPHGELTLDASDFEGASPCTTY